MDTTVIIAKSWDRFRFWCLHDNDPPLNPRDKKWVVVTSSRDVEKLRGLRCQDNDDILLQSYPESGVVDALIAAGFWERGAGPTRSYKRNND